MEMFRASGALPVSHISIHQFGAFISAHSTNFRSLLYARRSICDKVWGYDEYNRVPALKELFGKRVLDFRLLDFKVPGTLLFSQWGLYKLMLTDEVEHPMSEGPRTESHFFHGLVVRLN